MHRLPAKIEKLNPVEGQKSRILERLRLVRRGQRPNRLQFVNHLPNDQIKIVSFLEISKADRNWNLGVYIRKALGAEPLRQI